MLIDGPVLAKACYEAGGTAQAVDSANVRKGFVRPILKVTADAPWEAGEPLLLTSEQCTAAEDLGTLLGLKENEKAHWSEVLEAVLCPKDKAKRGFTAKVKLVGTQAGGYAIEGELALGNEEGVKAAIEAAKGSSCVDRALLEADTGTFAPLIGNLPWFRIIPEEAFRSGALSLELGTHFGHGSDVGLVAGIRAPLFGKPRGGEEDLDAMRAGYSVPLKCEVTPCRKPGGDTVLFGLRLVTGPWEPPKKPADRPIGLMAGWASNPDGFIIGPSIALNDYMRAFGAASFGDDTEGDWLFGVTLNAKDNARKVIEGALDVTQGKTPEQTPPTPKPDPSKTDASGGQQTVTVASSQPAPKTGGTPTGGGPAISGRVWQVGEGNALRGVAFAHLELRLPGSDITLFVGRSDEGGTFSIAVPDAGTEYILQISVDGEVRLQTPPVSARRILESSQSTDFLLPEDGGA
ncbi:MAG: hypothetical protein FJX74_03660 [Armatimonadetes bacterium]|nr:hypothetical protein [Armatimonadota bacterium]